MKFILYTKQRQEQFIINVGLTIASELLESENINTTYKKNKLSSLSKLWQSA